MRLSVESSRSANLLAVDYFTAKTGSVRCTGKQTDNKV